MHLPAAHVNATYKRQYSRTHSGQDYCSPQILHSNTLTTLYASGHRQGQYELLFERMTKEI